MKLSRQRRFSINSVALAFLLPLAGLLIMELICALTFDGKYSLLYSDCYHQYYPFFNAFRSALLQGDSLLYSWDVGLGMDYLGLIAYYLASPLNLLSILVPESWTLGYFSLLMPIKLSLASLFFAIFLKKVFGKEDLSISLFGTFYGLCAWALGYQWNIMWLDTFALVPLVVLGMVSLLRERKFVLYTFTLFLSIFANYYIGFFVCIFVLLSFICYEICRWQSCKRFFTDLMLMALFSILAIGMTAVLSLPTLAALQTTQSSVNTFPEGFKLNITDDDTWLGLLDAMRQVAGNMNGGIEATYKEGLPNLYCGVGTILLSFLFLTSRDIRVRDKVCCVFLLLFFNVSFIIRQLDYIWHGFHFTNMIPYRFSFLYSFVMLYMAYRAWLHRRHFRIWQVITAGVLSLALVFCSQEMEGFYQLLQGEKYMMPWQGWENIQYNIQVISENSTYVLYNLLFLAGYLASLLFGCRTAAPVDKEKWQDWLDRVQYKRKYAPMICLAVMGVELILHLVSFGSLFPATNVSNYPKGTADTAEVIRYMERAEEGALFYRTETTHSQTLNDGALNGYHGVSAFTSSANVKVTEFMQSLGYGAKNTYNRYCFEEASPVANLFLNLKYMIERDGNVEENPYFYDVYSAGSVHLLLNNAYLPLGFLTNAQILNVDFENAENPFLLQNDLMRKATGIDADCWHFLQGNQVTIHGSDLQLTSQNRSGYCTYQVGDTKGTVSINFTADREGLLCFHVDQTKRNSLSVYLNGGESPLYTESYSLPQTLAACNVIPGDVVTITFKCSANESGSINVTAAILDETVFRKGYEVLAASTINLQVFENTYIEGTIECDRDGVLYTSIPQNGNWTATVDGIPAQALIIGNAMVGLNLSEGKHTIAFQYKNFSFQLGLIVTLCFLVLFLGLYLWQYRPLRKQKKGKYEK